jgi:hypothetical protein
MKIRNIDLAFALMEAPPSQFKEFMATPRALVAFAQYLAERPASPNANRTACALLDLHVPPESHRERMPEVEAGREAVAAAVARLNTDYDRSPLHARCALTHLAWVCKALAWRLEHDEGERQKEAIRQNHRTVDRLFLYDHELQDDEWRVYRSILARKQRSDKQPTHTFKSAAPPPEPADIAIRG